MATPHNLFVARVIGDRNDKDFITLELAKHDQVIFSLNPDVPDEFYTIVFVKKDDVRPGVGVPYNPFE